MRAVLITGFTCATFIACLAIIKNVPASVFVTSSGFGATIGAAALRRNA